MNNLPVDINKLIYVHYFGQAFYEIIPWLNAYECSLDLSNNTINILNHIDLINVFEYNKWFDFPYKNLVNRIYRRNIPTFDPLNHTLSYVSTDDIENYPEYVITMFERHIYARQSSAQPIRFTLISDDANARIYSS